MLALGPPRPRSDRDRLPNNLIGTRTTWRTRRDDWDRADSENSRPKSMNPMPRGPCFIPGRRREANRFPPAGTRYKGGNTRTKINRMPKRSRMTRPSEAEGAFSQAWGSCPNPEKAGRPRAAPSSFRSASDRLFLSGLLASRARLRFTG